MTSPAPNASHPVVVIVGPPGAGKTSVGKQLARRWLTTFRDTDHDVEEATGRRIADIFVESGEPAFRELERAAVAAALGEHPGVLALGGGAIMDDGVRQVLREHRVVFLDVGLADAMRRMGMNRSRPLLVGNVRAQWQELAAERRPLYLSVADQVVATGGQPVAEVVQQIVEYWAEQQ